MQFLFIGTQTNDQDKFSTCKLSRNDESLQTAVNIYQVCSNEKPFGKINQFYIGLYINLKTDGTSTSKLKLFKKDVILLIIHICRISENTYIIFVVGFL